MLIYLLTHFNVAGVSFPLNILFIARIMLADYQDAQFCTNTFQLRKIAATFIALMVPAIKNASVLVAVVVAMLASVLCQAYQVEGGLMLASLSAMVAGYSYDKFLGGPVSQQPEGDKS